MARFRGRYDYTVDAKGRINIPAKFRKMITPEADETFVICRAPDGCLWAFPQDEWERYEDKMDTIMAPSPETSKIQRLIQNSATDSQLDKQGRITLSPLQQKTVGITKNVTLLGRRRFIEIWDTGRFETYCSDSDDFDKMYYTAVQNGLNPA